MLFLGIVGSAACNGQGNCNQGVSGNGKCVCFAPYSGPACNTRNDLVFVRILTLFTATITAGAPANGPTAGGFQLTVSGVSFGSSGSVWLGTTPTEACSIVVWTSTRILCNMPSVTPKLFSNGHVNITVKHSSVCVCFYLFVRFNAPQIERTAAVRLSFASTLLC